MLKLGNLNYRQPEQHKKLNAEDTVAWLRNAGAIDDNPWMLGDYEKIKNKWFGQAAYVIGTGPTLAPFLKKFGWEYFEGKHTIGINHAIEEWDGFEWFFFLDKRFLDRTTYDMEKFKGLIIAQNTTGYKPAENIVTFKCRSDMPTEKIEDGVYSSNLSGLAALHIAIISGANPIYLVGHGMGDSNPEAYHYREDYTGEVKDPAIWKKFYRVRTYFDNFSQWRHKIFSVSDYSEYTAIENIPLDDFQEKTSIRIEGRLPRIAHLSFSPDLAVHAETTRQMVCRGYGINRLFSFSGLAESDFKPDLYVLNHFLSTDHQIRNFADKGRAIDIVHTRNCMPDNQFRKSVAMSDYYRDLMIGNGIDQDKIEVIPACINWQDYTDDPDYGSKTFGRITRWSTGKIPPWWNEMLLRIFKQSPESRCLMYVQLLDKKRKTLYHEQMIYDTSVFIFENKNRYLKNMSFYVHANGFFVEISPHAILEAMASGLPIVYLYEDSISEMVGKTGIACENMQELEAMILQLLSWPEERLRAAGEKCRERVKQYGAEVMLEKYDRMIKECLDE